MQSRSSCRETFICSKTFQIIGHFAAMLPQWDHRFSSGPLVPMWVSYRFFSFLLLPQTCWCVKLIAPRCERVTSTSIIWSKKKKKANEFPLKKKMNKDNTHHLHIREIQYSIPSCLVWVLYTVSHCNVLSLGDSSFS